MKGGGEMYVKKAGLQTCEREGVMKVSSSGSLREREWARVCEKKKRERGKAYVCLSCVRTALKHVRGLAASSLHLGVEFSEGKWGSEWKAFIFWSSPADASVWPSVKVHAEIRGGAIRSHSFYSITEKITVLSSRLKVRHGFRAKM